VVGGKRKGILVPKKRRKKDRARYRVGKKRGVLELGEQKSAWAAPSRHGRKKKGGDSPLEEPGKNALKKAPSGEGQEGERKKRVASQGKGRNRGGGRNRLLHGYTKIKGATFRFGRRGGSRETVSTSSIVGEEEGQEARRGTRKKKRKKPQVDLVREEASHLLREGHKTPPPPPSKNRTKHPPPSQGNKEKGGGKKRAASERKGETQRGLIMRRERGRKKHQSGKYSRTPSERKESFISIVTGEGEKMKPSRLDPEEPKANAPTDLKG